VIVEILGSVEVSAGVLEMWCITADCDREWKVEFDMRNNQSPSALAVEQYHQPEGDNDIARQQRHSVRGHDR
jgi:hypothetical protein